MAITWRERWTTEDEINFIRGLAANNPDTFRRYAALLRSGVRMYAPPVILRDVLAAVDEMSPLVKQGKTATAAVPGRVH